ncbi:MAG: acyl-CoA synthetase FdrA [Alphaproteobacteria bacterium]|nr:acyl-CoA synthetase FdrA [Alphaproteobacteria bacterium]
MSVTLNRVRRAFYMDSVALMQLSQAIGRLPGVTSAALMIGSDNNKALLGDAGLLAEEGAAATANDLIIAVTSTDEVLGKDALSRAESLLERPVSNDNGATPHAGSLGSALARLEDANIALISVPGEFAAAEARKALRRGLHVMLFSDNVSVAQERALKEDARTRGLLLMGPDCGTALIGGVPLAFSNVVPGGNIGIISASGTGLQEVSSLIARHGGGISHGIGVGGRDLNEEVGGITTLMALQALEEDPATEHIIVISKPPGSAVAAMVLDRIGASTKEFTVCLVGLDRIDVPKNAKAVPTLKAAADAALGGHAIGTDFDAASLAQKICMERRSAAGPWIRGLYSGGTLCAEAQIVMRSAGLDVASNAPVPGARTLAGSHADMHTAIDLGADEYTVARPHPMIDPSVRHDELMAAAGHPGTAVILLDLVIGYGAHEDPAGELASTLDGLELPLPPIVASVCGTRGDPQGYESQVAKLRAAGIHVAPSNAQAAELAVEIARHASL